MDKNPGTVVQQSNGSSHLRNVLGGFASFVLVLGCLPLLCQCDSDDNTSDDAIAEMYIEEFEGINSYRKGETPLFKALREKQFGVAERLLARGADINQLSDYSWVSEKRNCTPLIFAIQRADKKMVEFLLSHDADVLRCNQDGRSPLAVAASQNWGDLVEKLVKKGADINAADKKGMTPLMQSVESRNAEMVKLLLKLGADVNCSSGAFLGRKALDYAKKTGRQDIIDILTAAGAE